MTEGAEDEAAPAAGSPEAKSAETAKRWIQELHLADQFWEKYRARAKTILDRYEDQREEGTSKRRLNLFWSNIETLKPACYARVPQAVVLRRFTDEDKVARVASEVLERAINFSLDSYDFDTMLKDVRDEFLLLGKGQSWIRYVPTFEEVPPEAGEASEGPEKEDYEEPGEPAEPNERLTGEEVVCEHVSYEDWGTNKCRKWSEVRFVWRRAYMDRKALKARFGDEIGGKVPLDWKPEGVKDDAAEMFAKACVYEIWDKDSRKAYWISKSMSSQPLDERDDPLQLKDFFPCPMPAFGTLSPRSLVPIPDYAQYQDQCEEIDNLTGRISVLTKALRMAGFYAGDQKAEIQQVFTSQLENQLIPVEDWSTFTDKGGVKGLIEWVPVDMVMKVLQGLYEVRERAKAALYEITGISDIMRGDTDPNETAAAQGLKSTWGSSRVREKQKEMARFCRDVMRLKGEVIAERFSIETIAQMSNYQLLTRAEKQQVQMYQQAMQMLQQQAAQQQPPAMPGQPAAPPPQAPQIPPPLPPEKMELVDLPAWEDVDELYKSNWRRQCRIDIESNSTVEPDLMSDKRDATEYVTAVGGLIQNALVAVQQAPPLGRLVGETIKYVARRFQAGREMEEIIDKVMDEIAAMQAQPPEQAQTGKSPEELAVEQAKVEVAREKNQVSLKKLETDEANSQRDHDSEMRASEAEEMRAQADVEIAREATRAAQAAAAAKALPVNGAFY